MRKKDILGNFVKSSGVVYGHAIRKISEPVAGYTALIRFLAGSRELCVNDDGKELQLSGEGYQWLMILPMEEPLCITAFYDPDNVLLEWYFDISKGNFLDENGMPCMDDLYLDLVIMPNGSNYTLDTEELLDAYEKGVIKKEDFDYAYQIRDGILKSKWNDVGYLKEVSNKLLAEYGKEED